nr:glyceraldehyde-3-phosphate dehydrogenase, testis-specific-like [Ipomoea batatas]
MVMRRRIALCRRLPLYVQSGFWSSSHEGSPWPGGRAGKHGGQREWRWFSAAVHSGAPVSASVTAPGHSAMTCCIPRRFIDLLPVPDGPAYGVARPQSWFPGIVPGFLALGSVLGMQRHFWGSWVVVNRLYNFFTLDSFLMAFGPAPVLNAHAYTSKVDDLREVGALCWVRVSAVLGDVTAAMTCYRRFIDPAASTVGYGGAQSGRQSGFQPGQRTGMQRHSGQFGGGQQAYNFHSRQSDAFGPHRVSRRLYIARHVRFNESVFPFHSSAGSTGSVSPPPGLPWASVSSSVVSLALMPVAPVGLSLSSAGGVALSVASSSAFLSTPVPIECAHVTPPQIDLKHIDEHMRIQEAIVTDSHGRKKTVVLSVNGDVHVDEDIIRREKEFNVGTSEVGSGDLEAGQSSSGAMQRSQA